MIKVTKIPEQVLAGGYSLEFHQALLQYGFQVQEDTLDDSIKIIQQPSDSQQPPKVWSVQRWSTSAIIVLHRATKQLEVLPTAEFEARYEKVWDLTNNLLYQEKQLTEYFAFQLRSLSYDDLVDLMIYLNPRTKPMTDRQVLEEYKTIRRAKVTGEVAIKNMVVNPSDWVLGTPTLDSYFVVPDDSMWIQYHQA